MKPLKLLTSFSIAALTINTAFALDAAAIRKLATSEHNEQGLLKELQIFPIAREFKLNVITHLPETGGKPTTLKRTMKVIEKKYLVSETSIPMQVENSSLHFTNVITYCQDDLRYKMWSLMNLIFKGEKTELVSQFDGIYLKDKQVLSWAMVPDKNRPGVNSSIIQTFHKDKETWKSYDYSDGKLVAILSGEDIPVKK